MVLHEVEHSSPKTDCSGCLTAAKSFSQDPHSMNLKSTVHHQGCQSSFQHHSLGQMGRSTGPWCLNPHRVPHDTIQANRPCISSIKSRSRTFPGLPARPGFYHSVTAINQTPWTMYSQQSSIHYHPSKTTQHKNCIRHEKQHTWRNCPTWKSGKGNTATTKQFTGQTTVQNNFSNKPIRQTNTPEIAKKAKHWVYKQSRTHMTSEVAIHVVEHSSPKTNNNIHDGRESTIWSTESNRKLQQGTQSGMALCWQRLHNSSMKSWLWDFPWPSGPTKFLPHNQNKHRTPQNKGQVHKKSFN